MVCKWVCVCLLVVTYSAGSVSLCLLSSNAWVSTRMDARPGGIGDAYVLRLMGCESKVKGARVKRLVSGRD